MDENNPAPEPIWCVVANVVNERLSGQEKIPRRGTKHFSPDTKVYCYPWHMGAGLGHHFLVYGQHRNSHRYVMMVMESDRLTNWRVKLIYSPHVIAAMSAYWDGSEKSKEYAEHIVAFMKAKEAGTLQEYILQWGYSLDYACRHRRDRRP